MVLISKIRTKSSSRLPLDIPLYISQLTRNFLLEFHMIICSHSQCQSMNVTSTCKSNCHIPIFLLIVIQRLFIRLNGRGLWTAIGFISCSHLKAPRHTSNNEEFDRRGSCCGHLLHHGYHIALKALAFPIDMPPDLVGPLSLCSGCQMNTSSHQEKASTNRYQTSFSISLCLAETDLSSYTRNTFVA